ncbi:hypothetical protein [Paenibacillus xylanexedens]|uniref:hypothetical protein n=1 Tax=Paenibacillus xylanexedens TaxID=528191 RepID=UPI0011A66DF9|nr:hypothetical protein [Paenibacillus xylanexedens]
MKKFIAFLTLIIFMFNFSSSVIFASTSKVSSSIIEKVSYEDGYYVAVTKDSDGGSWTLMITEKTFNEKSLKWLSNKYVGTEVRVFYNGDLESDDSVVITKVEWSIWK